jgi:hypothetical protein
MSLVQRRGLNNVLVRWVQRHESMATLFRSTQPAERSMFFPSKTLPAEHIAFTQPLAQQNPSQTDAGSIQRLLISSFDTQAPGVAGANTLLTSDTTPPAEAVHPRIESQPSEDREWKRLQIIVRRHREKDEMGQDSSSQAVSLGSGSTQPAVPDAPDLLRISSTANLPPAVQPAASLEPHQFDESTTKPIQGMAEGNDNFEVPTIPKSSPRNARQVQRKVESLSSPPRRQKQATQSQQGLERTVPSVEESDDSPFPTILHEADHAVHRQEARSGDDESPRPLLESVWPVQRMEKLTPAGIETENPPSPNRSDQKRVDTRTIISPAREETVTTPYDLAKQDASVKKRAVPVEVLPPSGSRPVHHNLAASGSLIQMQSLGNRTPMDKKGDTLVGTPIGMLPADLWMLLGQTPPDALELYPAKELTLTGTGHQAGVLQRSTLPVAAPALISHSAFKQSETVPAIESPPGLGALPSFGEPGKMGNKDEEKPLAEPDIDKLADLVYEEVRHRLILEGERVHPRR